MKAQTFNVMGSGELDDLVNKNVPEAKGNYEYIAEEESNNDTDRAYTGVDGKLDEIDRKNVAAGDFQYRARMLLNLLVGKGILPAGDYLIRVSW